MKIKFIIKAIIRCLFKPYVLKGEIKDTDFLFFKFNNTRKDYNILFNEIYSHCNFDKENLKIEKAKKINFSLLRIFTSNTRFFKRIRSSNNFIVSLYLFLKLLQYIQLHELIKELSFKHLIVFSDSRPEENILVQYAKSKNIFTTSMQHGLYIDYEGLPNINMLNYIEFSSDFLLAWGNSTVELFNKYNQNFEGYVVGKPTVKIDSTRSFKEGYIAVVFDQPMFHNINQEILNIAYKYCQEENKKVIVRVHPQDNISHYMINKELTNFNVDLDDVGLILAHTSSMIYEYLAKGHRVYKYLTEIPYNKISDEITFSSFEELKVIENIKFNFQDESSFHIKFINGDSKKKYREFFKQMSNLSK